MENKEMKKPIPVELGDDALDNVSGGSVAHLEYYCEDCKVYYIVPMFQCPECGRVPLLAVEHTELDE